MGKALVEGAAAAEAKAAGEAARVNAILEPAIKGLGTREKEMKYMAKKRETDTTRKARRGKPNRGYTTAPPAPPDDGKDGDKDDKEDEKEAGANNLLDAAMAADGGGGGGGAEGATGK